MTTTSTNPLLKPLQIGRLTVPGRLYKSATSETRATDEGYATDELLEFYEPMVRAGTPLIVTGNLFVSLQSKSAGRQAGIDSDDKKPGLREWVQLAHSGGSFLVAQLNHGGRQMVRSSDPGKATVSASSVREPLYGTKPRPLRADEIPALVDTFAAAAARAQDVGFDGVQIHAAHGYLLGQFLTPHTNRRNDEYAQLDIPVICVGGFHTATGMESAIETGRCDAVSAARAFIADPYLFKNVQTPTPGRPVCGYCNGCIARFGGRPIDCYNDEIRAQKDLMLRRAEGVL